MPRGAPDYSNVSVGQPLHRLEDMGELAVRLDSPVAFDRGGTVVWLTSFESGLQGSVLGLSDSECVGRLDSSRSHNGSFSVKLDPSDEENSSAIYGRVIQFLLTGKIGGEFSASLDTDPLQLRLSLFYRDGTNCTKGSLKYWPATGDWEVQTEAGDWEVVLEDTKLQQGPSAWHPIKLIIDVDEAEYVRAIVGREVIDLSDYSLYVTEDDSLGQLEVRVTVWGASATHAPVYIDSLIVTQNEP